MGALRGRLRAVPTWLAVVALAVVGGVVPVFVAHRYGALGIPRNDDWSYALATFRLGGEGRFDLNGWAAVNVVGQILPGVPAVWVFGRRFTPLQIEVVLFGLAGLVALFELGCRLVSRARALFVALIVALCPFWGPLAVSFMTDVPGISMAFVTLAFGAAALRPPATPGADRIRPSLYAATMAAGFWAYTIRDNAIVATIAVTLVAAWCAWRGSRRDRLAVGAGIAAWIAALFLFMAWKEGAAGYQTPSFTIHHVVVRTALRRSVQLLPVLGLMTAPAVALAGPVRLVTASFRRAPRAAGLVAVAVGGVAAVVTIARSRPLGTGNYLDEAGTLGTDLMRGARDPILGDGVPVVLGVIGVVSVAIIAVAIVRPLADEWVRLRERGFGPPPDPSAFLVGLAALGFSMFIVASGVAGNAVWDRYVLSVVPLVALLVLRAARTVPGGNESTRRLGGAVALAGLGALGLVFSVNSASYDGARWNVASEAADQIGRPGRVNGGFEWVDYQAGEEIYLGGLPRGRFCVVLRSESERPRPEDPRVVASAGVWGPTGTQTWIVARRTGVCEG